MSRLSELLGIACENVEAVEYEEPPGDSVYAIGTSIRFADGTRLSAQFWRLIKAGKPLVSIFDHRQKYGLPAPIDAIQILDGEVRGKRIVEASMSETTGDLCFRFEDDVTLEVFNFTAFEIWEIAFADGAVELSNYALNGSA
jgi:hypothetical protein